VRNIHDKISGVRYRWECVKTAANYINETYLCKKFSKSIKI
jgi:hypothetical protein